MKSVTPYAILLFLASSAVLSSSVNAICVRRNFTISPGDISSAPFSLPAAPAPAPAANEYQTSSPIPSLPLPFPQFTNPALKSICDKTEHSKKCVESAIPYLHGDVNPTSVLMMEIQALRKRFKDGIDLIHSLYYGASSDVQSGLDVCLDVYGSGLADVDDSLAAISAKDAGKLNVVLSAAVDYPDTCDDAFDGIGEQSLLQETNQMIGTIASNCLAISELLPWIYPEI